VKRALAVVLGVLLGLILLEGACRLGAWPSTLYRAARARRDGAGKYRVLILGDSFVQPKSELGRRLERYFQDHGAVCLNLAFRGMGPVEYLRAFRVYGAQFEPDLVLFNFTTINDVTDTMFREPAELDHWMSYSPPPVRSFLLASARENLERWRETCWILGLQEAARRGRDRTAAQVENPFLAQGGSSMPDLMTLNVDVPPAAEGVWAEIVRIVDAIHGDCARRGARFLISVFPSTEQVNASHYAEFRKLGYRLDERMLAQHPVQDRFQRLCRERALACNDLLPAFRARKKEEFFEFNDEHFNSRGQELAAALILGKLESLGWDRPPQQPH